MKDLQTEAEKKPFAAAVKALWIEMFEDKESYVDHYMSSSWKHNRVLHCAGRAARSALHCGCLHEESRTGKRIYGAVGYGGTSYLQRGRGAVYVSDAGGRGDLPSV